MGGGDGARLGGPLLFGQDGWKLVPSHFAERHGLIVIIALGEWIVAIGAGVERAVDGGVVAAATWASPLPPHVVAVLRRRGDRRRAPAHPCRAGDEQNGIARDSYSYLHFPMVAGIVLVALGMKKTLGDTGDPLKLVPAAAMLGGASLYLLAHVAFRLRNIRSLNRPRLATSGLVLALIPVATEIPALTNLAIVSAGLVALVPYETTRYAEKREHIRHQLEHGETPGPCTATHGAPRGPQRRSTTGAGRPTPRFWSKRWGCHPGRASSTLPPAPACSPRP